MKKILLVLTIILMVSCKQTSIAEKPQNYTNWEVEVKYLDNTIDTIAIRSIDKPFLHVTDHVSTVRNGDSWAVVASYVKTFKILNEK